MIRLLEYINSDLSFVNFIKDLDKKEASPRKLKEYYSSGDVKSLLSEYGFYMDQADISIGYTIKIYTNAFVPGMLTEAKIEMTFFPSQFPHFIEIKFEIYHKLIDILINDIKYDMNEEDDEILINWLILFLMSESTTTDQKEVMNLLKILQNARKDVQNII